jgi:hypothetical protein
MVSHEGGEVKVGRRSLSALSKNVEAPAQMLTENVYLSLWLAMKKVD